MVGKLSSLVPDYWVARALVVSIVVVASPSTHHTTRSRSRSKAEETLVIVVIYHHCVLANNRSKQLIRTRDDVDHHLIGAIHCFLHLQNILVPLSHEKRQAIVVRAKDYSASFREQEHIALLSLDLLARLVFDICICPISTP
jgi:hypothetical protein